MEASNSSSLPEPACAENKHPLCRWFFQEVPPRKKVETPVVEKDPRKRKAAKSSGPSGMGNPGQGWLVWCPTAGGCLGGGAKTDQGKNIGDLPQKIWNQSYETHAVMAFCFKVTYLSFQLVGPFYISHVFFWSGEGCGDWGRLIAMGMAPLTRQVAWNDDPWWSSAEIEINIHTTANAMDH